MAKSRSYSSRSRKYRPGPALSTVQILFCLVIILIGLGFSQLGQLSVPLQVLTVFLVVMALITGSSVLYFIWRHQHLRHRALQLADIDTMTGYEFEHYVAAVLRDRGYYDVTVTAAAQDFGVDVLYRDETTTYAAQVKRYKGFVGVEALYQATGGRDYYHKQRAVVITNSYFSAAAIELARETNMELINRDQLTEWILDYQQHQGQLPPEV
ncbi:MAG TPA: restriction endonuclease [Vitreimonas sp.]|nr:restriction endonuclease [Vitreimonas sp.]